MTRRPPEMMTPEEAQEWGIGVVGAMYADDRAELQRLLTEGDEFNAANMRLMLTVLTAAVGIVLRRIEPLGSQQFVGLEVGDDATEAAVHAGRIITTGINEDHATQQDLITALIRRAAELGDRAGARLLSDALIVVVELLREVIAEHRRQPEP